MKTEQDELIEIIDDSLEEIEEPIYDAWDTSGDDEILMHVADLEKLNPRYTIQQDNWKTQHRHSNLPSTEYAKKPAEKEPSVMPAGKLVARFQSAAKLVKEEEKPGHQVTPEGSAFANKGQLPPFPVPELKFDDESELEHMLLSEEQDRAMNSVERNHVDEDVKPRHSHHRQLTFLTQQPSMNEYISNDSRESSVTPETGHKKVRAITLSEEQEHVIELARRKMNIFYTGSAGTGKSVLLRELIKTLKSTYGTSGAVAVTASTGLAACNIGGITLHSFAGIGLGVGDEAMLLKKVRRSAKHRERWKNIKALVIDEISMIDGTLLDKLDGIAKTLRRSSKPFGGIQIILCGDFFQLPPVTKGDQQIKFAFQSYSWRKAIDATIILKKVFRQQGDHLFINMLNEMRTGIISDQTLNEFRELSRPLPNDEIVPAELFSTRAEVDNANYSRLKTLPGETMTYEASDGGVIDNAELRKKLLDNFLAPKKLELKVGAQVMNIKNMDATLVNGSLGKVLAFLDSDTFAFLKGPFNSNKLLNDEDVEKLVENPTSEEYWSEEEDLNVKVTKQKKKEMELEKTFMQDQQERVQIESPLSETIFDFFMVDTDSMSARLKANVERKKEIVRKLHTSARGAKLPLVQFFTPSGDARVVLVRPETWAMEDEKDVPLVSRTQLPLILAWSLSIHKSQGQTLSKVKVDLKRVFEKGQAYVALSRAVSRTGLQVLNFDRTKVKAHDIVVDFYQSLSSAGSVMNEINKKQIIGQQKTEENRSSSSTPDSDSRPPQKRNLETMLLNRMKQTKKKLGIQFLITQSSIWHTTLLLNILCHRKTR
ncbi:unnamed protein product [Kluyveromyces dobzhanskii CBS 2104]|uniref:ATP-dependent DNA helicase PIF1 n=1 Tax=Kluyveromyces dobzhanskii CBS 2104 TaxID=1427455 RepID=A0A0A8L254_9SACH|nr:unnamed protein product [Kluyveromyces dobzhanskii CBS 2104]